MKNMTEKCYQSGVCCKLFLINLNEEEYNSKKFETQFQEFGHIEDFTKAKNIGANILKQNKDGSCIYFKDNLCSIHKIRPQVCRDFFCTTKKEKFQDMVKQINQRKKLLKIKIR